MSAPVFRTIQSTFLAPAGDSEATPLQRRLDLSAEMGATGLSNLDRARSPVGMVGAPP
jgi:hypothetical protein